MKAGYVCLDVGGTEIKSAAVTPAGEVVEPVAYAPARASEAAQAVIAHLAGILQTAGKSLTRVLGAGLAFPGPFDYAGGICLLKGLDKFDRLYGVNLRQALAEATGIAPADIRFCNDVGAFALGEMGFGPAAGAERAMFLCIGTGCGSAFGVHGQLAPEGYPGVPSQGYVYDRPFLEGRVDDYLSKRGLMALAQARLGRSLAGKELAALCQAGDKAALDCFAQFGQWLRAAAEPNLQAFRPDCLCIGGQITKSAGYFLEPLAALCQALGISLYVTADTSRRALQGLTRCFPGG